MEILFQILSVWWMAFTGITKGIVSAIWSNLPELLQARQFFALFTPKGFITAAIGAKLGVPVIVVSILFFIAKYIFRKIRN